MELPFFIATYTFETQSLKLVKLEKTKQILYNSVAQMRDAIGL